MVMKTLMSIARALGVVALVLVLGTSVALAHGTPTISAQPTTVAAGGKITLSGDGMGENGQTVTITLKGMLFQAQLGTTKLSDDAYDAVVFTIPAKAPAGTYLIVAQNGSNTASISIEVTAAAAPKPTTAPTARPTAVPTTPPIAVPTVAPTAIPTTMAEMTTPAPTTTLVATGLSVATEQAGTPTPVAASAAAPTQAAAASPAATQTPEAMSMATTVATPAATTEAATQPAAGNAAAANAPTDQTTTGAAMPMPGAAPVLVRTRSPIEWALPLGVVVVGGALGLFLVTRDW
jgi:hypothetical protein